MQTESLGHDDIKLLCFSWSLVLLSEARVNSKVCSKKADGPPINWPYPAHPTQVYRALLHPLQALPTNLTQMQISLLHQTGPLLIYPRWRIPYYTTLLIYPRWRLPYYTTPANLPQIEITLLHIPCSFTPDGDYPTTPDRLPANQPQM